MVDMPAENVRQVVGVRFTKVGKLYHFDFSAHPDIKPGDFVIVETVRGRQMGQVMGFTDSEDGHDYRPIMRLATPRDLALRQEWESKQNEVLAKCQEKADELGGYEEAKFVAAQYNYDGSILTLLFTAEEKIDTNRLRRSLSKILPSQIDIRQVGPRDVAKLLGGYGACGIERCCSTFLTDFSPISIKMAKAQGISLNPSEITGMCGRLRCCLVYEYEQYVEARKKLPRKGKKTGTPYGEAKVIDVHPLRDAVTVWVQDMGRVMVEREDLVPLDELRALEKAAKSPCTKHGDGACDCGKPPGARRADQQNDSSD
ncbi:stage 0 sporulation family protein [Phototrophicus methaneseepsis]|uniref:Stage 0 sporulation family protein n=1 Tax=Phototrophicus methaneseepsis TaxID=2710758 RepID=A0A7S8IBS8_9CHLR|nr:regulatory iron-sulfur-containing complex subunit RicT [Phototrophicus methaneseepsis]QPC80790.1 stage 0 sporulation family protein [Phototrophicus methaneseepsis]